MLIFYVSRTLSNQTELCQGMMVAVQVQQLIFTERTADDELFVVAVRALDVCGEVSEM
jgi:hypothetical protein